MSERKRAIEDYIGWLGLTFLTGLWAAAMTGLGYFIHYLWSKLY